jgi:hypothetical protein
MIIYRGQAAGLVLLIVSGIAVAAPLSAGEKRLAAAAAACPDRGDVSRTAIPALPSDAIEATDSVRGEPHLSPENDRLEEYLNLHARIREDSGSATLMPWPGMRTHAN